MFIYQEEGMPLTVENNIKQMATTTTLTGQYPFHEIFHNQIAKWLSYVLDSLTNSIFEVLSRRWAVGVDLFFHVAAKKEAARC